MSLNLNPDALAATRDTLLKREARNTLTNGDVAGREDRASFADQLRASQTRAEQTERPQDIQKNQTTDQDYDQDISQASAQSMRPARKDQTDVRTPQTANQTAKTSQAAKTETDASVTGEIEVPATDAELAEAAASEVVITEAVVVPTVPTAQITPEQALAALAAQPDKTAAPDIQTAQSKSAAPKADAPIDALAQAISTLKSAVKTTTANKDASETVPAADTEAADKTTDAQIDQVVQALLSGKPLTAELKALSETPKVAEALKAVGSALAAIEQKRPETGQTAEAALAFALKGEDAKLKTVVEAKPADRKPEASPLDLKGNIPAASSPANTPQMASGQVAPETATIQTAPAALADVAARPAAKSSEPLADVKPASTSTETAPPMPAQAEASVKAAEALQLTRTEATLGSSLSTTALNNLTQMSAQIARHLTAKSTQFNMELHPADMGRVDVKLSINHDGSLSAALSFDSPVAESQFRAQADDLRRQLEAQGFQLAEGSLSFSSRQNSDQANQGQSPNNAPTFAEEAPDAARAAQAFGAFDQTPDASVPGALLAQKLGLDLLGAQTYRLSLNVTA